MKSVQSIPSKIYSLPALEQEITRWRMKNKRIVFTNGVFDILHEGHIASLSQAATYADVGRPRRRAAIGHALGRCGSGRRPRAPGRALAGA